MSVAVAVKVTLALEHWPGSTLTPKLVGQVIVGAVVSRTVTVKLQEMSRPLESVALQVTVVGPSGNVLPEAGVQVTGKWGLQSSEAVAVKATLALEHWPGSGLRVMLAGQVMVPTAPNTPTVKLQEL